MSDPVHLISLTLGVIAAGLIIGKLRWRGISLGTSGVLFAALIAGRMGLQIPSVVGMIGVILFVFCLGIGAGPTFLRTLLHQGKALALAAAAMMVSAVGAAWLVAYFLQLTPDLASGLFAGALTSTPALAAATDVLPPDTEAAVGFGVAYPFGVIAVILFVQLAPRFFASSADEEAAQETQESTPAKIRRVLVEVANPNLAGKRLRDVSVLSHSNCQVSRQLVDGKLLPIPRDFQLELGGRVLLVCSADKLPDVVEVLGVGCDDLNYVLNVEQQRRRIVATSAKIVGKSLKELHLRTKFGVTISRIVRQDIEFVPNSDEVIQFGDALTAVGEQEGLESFIQYAGHRERTSEETDLISLGFGLIAGILLGRVQVVAGGESIALGMAGGPLVVGLIMGHFGRIGPFVLRMPRPARLLLGEIGLTLFLAQAGTQAGENLSAVISDYGVSLCFGAIIIVTTPIVVGFFTARFLLKLGMLESLGGICGALTSTPGLGALSASVESSTPATSYAAVYPIALILVTLATPLLIWLVSL